MIGLSLTLVLTSQAPLDFRAVELSAALAAIEKRFGAPTKATPMRAAPALADRILIGHLEDASLELIKRELAQQYAAEWRPSLDDTLVLTPLPSAAKAREQRFLNRRRARVRGVLEGYRKEIQALAPLTASDGERYRAELKERQAAAEANRDRPPVTLTATPAERLTLRLIASLSPETIITTEPESFEIFSTSPTRFQSAFGVSAQAAIDQFSRDFSLFADPGNPNAGAASFATLELRRHEELVHMMVRVYDRWGQRIGAVGKWIDFHDGEDLARGTTEPSLPYEFEPTADERKAEALFTSGTRLPFADAKPILSREPLSYSPASVLISAATQAHQNLLCNPADATMKYTCTSGRGSLQAWLAQGIGTRLDLSDPSWIHIDTGDPYLADLDFTRRRVLGEILKEYGGRKPPLTEQVELAALLPERGRNRTAEDYLWLGAGNGRLVDIPGTKLYAALSSGSGAGAGLGRSGVFELQIPLRSTNSVFQSRLRDEVFASGETLHGTTSRGPSTALSLPSVLFATPTANGGAVYEDGMVTLRQSQERVAIVRRNGDPQAIELSFLADLISDPSAARQYAFDLERIGLGVRERADLQVRWKVSERESWSRSFTIEGGLTTRDAGPYSPSTLPEEIRKLLQAQPVDEEAGGEEPPPSTP